MSSRWHGGKGSKSRTKDQKTYSDNWDNIFGKKNPVEKPADNTHDDDEKPVGHDREPWQSRP